MWAFTNSQRASAVNLKSKTFEYFDANPDAILNNETIHRGKTDLVFVVGRNVYHGHQCLFAYLSAEIKKCLDMLQSEVVSYSPYNHGGILKAARSKVSEIPKLTIDAPLDVFEAIFHYAYSSKLVVAINLVPAVYALSKTLQIRGLQCVCARFLTNNLSINSIGALCRLVSFGALRDELQNGIIKSSHSDDEIAELNLTEALLCYLVKEANTVACSQTGQLSARLIVNLTGEYHGRLDEFKSTEPNDSLMAFGVLRWAYERLLTGERLAKTGRDDNVLSDDEESDGSNSAHMGNNSISRRRRAGSHFQFLARLNAVSGNIRKINSSNIESMTSDEEDAEAQSEIEDRIVNSPNSTNLYHITTQDVRISIDIDDLILDWKQNNCSSELTSTDILLTDLNDKYGLLKLFLPTGSSQSETCLLAQTTLGVGSTVIWLAKLAGHLVSLSIKRQPFRSNSQSNSELAKEISSILQYSNYSQEKRHNSSHLSSSSFNSSSLSSSSLNDSDSEKLIPNEFSQRLHEKVVEKLNRELNQLKVPHDSECDDELCLTMTADSSTHLARLAAVTSPTIVTNHLDSDRNYNDNLHDSMDYNYDFNTLNLRTQLLCTNSEEQEEIKTVEENHQIPLRLLDARSGFGANLLQFDKSIILLIIGGYTRKGCLNSVELLIHVDKESEEFDLDTPLLIPIKGPKLTTLRGRLAVVSSQLNSNDNSYDIIYACGGSTGSKDLTSVEKLSSESLKLWLENNELQSNRINCADKHDERYSSNSSNFSINNQINYSQNHRYSNPSIWQLVQNLHQPRSSPTAVDLSQLRCGSLISNNKGSILVAGGLSDAKPLNTVEMYIPDRNEWIYLPNMLEGRYEASSDVLTSHNLVVVAGGIAGGSLTESNRIVEAFDPRCAEWIRLPGPFINTSGQFRGASLTQCPTLKDQLLLIGGYNGLETLDNTWIFDPPAWQWRPGPNLLIARSNSCAITLPNRTSSIILGGYNPSKPFGGFLDTIEMIS